MPVNGYIHVTDTYSSTACITIYSWCPVLCYVGTYVVLIIFVTIASEVTLYSHLQSVFIGYGFFVITSLYCKLS